MITGDIIKVRFVTEMAGVATSNQHYWRVQSVVSDNPSQALDDLARLFWTSINSRLWNGVVLSCATWDNLTRPERALVFLSLPGGSPSEMGPPSSVVRLNRYSLNAAGGKGFRSSLSFSGVTEPTSVRGRTVVPTNYGAVSLFFSSQQTLTVTGNTMFPAIRHRTAVGPPQVYGYEDAYSAQIQFRFLLLARRKSSLCAR